MDIALERKLITSFKKIYSEEKTCEAAADAVVPDTQEDIQRILSSDYSCTIKSKDIDSGRITVRGELHTAVLYLPESESGISRLDITAPFSAEFLVQEADSGCFASADIKLTAADTRMLNPRKLSVKAEIGVTAECYKDHSFEWYEVPENADAAAFFKTGSTALNTVALASEKTIALEDEFSLPSATTEYSLLSAAVKAAYDSSERIGAKLIVRGHLELKACVSDGAGNVSSLDFSSAFSQLFELPGDDGELSFEVKMLKTGEYFEINNGLLCSDVHVLAQLVCTQQHEIGYISDAYACGATYETEYIELLLPQSLTEQSMNAGLQLRYDSDNGVSKILWSSARVGRTEIKDGKLSGTVIAEVMFADKNGRPDSCRVRGTVEAEPEMSGDEIISRVNASVSELTVIPAGDSIDIRAGVLISCGSEKTESVTALSAMSVDEASVKCDCASLYIKRAEDEDIWSLAKKYGSSEAAIMRVNGLEEASDALGKMLLIPVM